VDDKRVLTFPNARYIFGRVEWEYWSGPVINDEGDPITDSVKPIVEAGLADLVATNHQLTPEVRLLPSPGHTPGHFAVLIESEGRSSVLSGDLIHHPILFSDPQICVHPDRDQGAAEAARRNFLTRFEDKPIPVFGAHFAHPTAGWVVRDGEAWKFRVEESMDDSASVEFSEDGRSWVRR